MDTEPRGETERDDSLLADVLSAARRLAPSTRAEFLMDWLMSRADASRCAIVPFEAGTAGEPLAFLLRDQPPGASDPRHVPRAILHHVAATRQPLVRDDVRDASGPLGPSDTIADQGVGSYMAVPVILSGELIAVMYADRYQRSGGFGADTCALFEKFAYALARPLIELRDTQRREEYARLRDGLSSSGRDVSTTASPALARVLDVARRLAPHRDENLLLLGETGSGKEWLARRIHDDSGRSGPFVAFNVSGTVPELFESELMGSVRGAFTGAMDRTGLAEEAAGGTLFLDEIGDLELSNQVRLLRFLQEHAVRPVGSAKEKRVDVRVVAATNRDVAALIREGTFREDLVHRFAPPLRVPALRERSEEILALANDWLDGKCQEKRIARRQLSRACEDFLLEYSWPGNVRQLQMVLTQALILGDDGEIEESLLQSLCEERVAREPRVDAPPLTWPEFRRWREDLERRWLEQALADGERNLEEAARAVRCPSSTFRNLVTKHDVR